MRLRENEPTGCIYGSVLRPVVPSSRKDAPVALFKTRRRSGKDVSGFAQAKEVACEQSLHQLVEVMIPSMKEIMEGQRLMLCFVWPVVGKKQL